MCCVFRPAFGCCALVEIHKWNFSMTDRTGKTYTGEGSASLKKLEKPVWRPKGRQRNNFKSLPCNLMKTNCCKSLSCLPFGLQSCFQAI